ncbi:hypothetical protein CP985_03415 [Malaciobacter mytili LMG 24559]|uniref:MoxR-like ATPase n=1 Tax=Malaciobacter mytili LMG 24559 TaxID=1032238 RepID=A0AAX2AK52_9BACT|nr:AAA family ATPase [Malaciobacter mytili]AXH16406.1 ATP-binding protein (AAA domain) [Malaciobacter mytili LMG 24559]RXK16473.1 hypothetical protein CP985_03415 [Malaciobacter mytili LMG 24559]
MSNNEISTIIDMTKAKEYKDKLRKLFEEMELRAIEREELIRIIALTYFAKANTFLIGERGVGKSYVIDMFGSIISGAKKLWQIVGKEDTTTEELFGRIYTTNEGELKINTKGSLLEAFSIFIDEMFKIKGRKLSGLLEVLIDRTYTYGDGEKKKTDINCFFAASNEYPEDKFMAPYVDRFDFWVVVKAIAERENRKKLYLNDFIQEPILTKYFSKEDIDFIYKESDKVIFDKILVERFIDITQEFIKSEVKTSDRKYKRTVKFMKIVAYLNGRSYIDISDFILLLFTSWHNKTEKERVDKIFYNYIFRNEQYLENVINTINSDFKEIKLELNNNYINLIYYKKIFDINNKEEYLTNYENINLISSSCSYLLEVIKNELYSFRNVVEQVNKLFENNIFFVNKTNQVFTPKIEELIKELEKDIKEKIVMLEEWLKINKTLLEYKTNQQKVNLEIAY